MEDGSIGRRYARALTAVLSTENDTYVLSRAEQELSNLARLFADKSSDFRMLFQNPCFSIEQRTAVMQQLAQTHSFHPMTSRFLLILVQRDRIRFISSIAKAFRKEVDRHLNRVRAEFVSAKAIDATVLNELKALLEKKNGKDLVITSRIDEDLISGIRIEIEGKVFDGSIRSRLNQLKAAI